MVSHSIKKLNMGVTYYSVCGVVTSVDEKDKELLHIELVNNW